jgi:hypothetical protein
MVRQRGFEISKSYLDFGDEVVFAMNILSLSDLST